MTFQEKILIADSDTRELFVLQEALRRLGEPYRVSIAQDVSEMRGQAQDTDFALLVIDERLLRKGDAQVSRFLERCADLAVIWLTANGCHNLDPMLAAVPSRSRCLEKPVEIAQIRQAARDLLQPQSNLSNPSQP